jgi:two-component system, OmpR family, sensor histidine kinase KdpD
LRHRALRVLLSIVAVTALTYIASQAIPVNATTVGFAYLLLVLVIASAWGFIEAAVTSLAATVLYNYFFLPPVKTFTIADPQNWVALFSFIATALVASRLSAVARHRTVEAVRRRQDVERLYTFSRSLLLIDTADSFARQLARKLADTFDLEAVVLYERATGEFYRAGPFEFDGIDDQLREAALHGAAYFDPERRRAITAVRLGSEPIAGLAIQGPNMPDSMLQGIANLVAIGLERVRADQLAHQVEVAHQSEQLRTTIIDAMAHEFKTPLTSIKAATTSLLSDPGQPAAARTEMLKIADQEAQHLAMLIDDAVEMARLDVANINVQREMSDIREMVEEVVESMRPAIDDRTLDVRCESPLPSVGLDRRLVRLAIRQLIDNALKYSPSAAPVHIRITGGHGAVMMEITDYGNGIAPQEQRRIFERFYRSPDVKTQIPGSGLGLSIAASIVKAHDGTLTVSSHPGETTFAMTLPVAAKAQAS